MKIAKGVKNGAFNPSEKEIKALKNMADGKPDDVAVLDAGYSLTKKSAECMAKRIRDKYTDANGGLLIALESVGITLDSVASTIKDGLSAKRPIKRGQSVALVPDHPTRHKYLETALDVMGAKAPKQHVVTETKTHEETITIVDGLRDNPEAITLLQRKLAERKSKTIDITPVITGDDDGTAST